ncbi:unnamed protein product [Spirodela intermedia]|uniref:Uncharacterized protein n=1 Tax=Spirodela intermedia TaxID=51605 RepID=A0A7I8J348_SPIIN|nr:unnamed protein product [Spirodela intermedia]CAA6663831.1 unnamed protein product [Spirodela intermedia]
MGRPLLIHGASPTGNSALFLPIISCIIWT